MQTAPALALKRLSSATEGSFEGLASAYGVLDRHGDVMLPGSFARSVEAFKAGDLVVPLLLDHQLAIGSVTGMRDTSAGLMVTAQLALGTPEAARVFELTKAGPAPLSVGFTFQADDYTVRPDGGRDFTGVDVFELSVVTVAANPAAGTTSVKGLRAVEELLSKELGLSARQAKTFIAKGREAIKQSDTDPWPAIAEALRDGAAKLKLFPEKHK